MKHQNIIHRPARPDVKTNQRGQQHQQRQARLDQFADDCSQGFLPRDGDFNGFCGGLHCVFAGSAIKVADGAVGASRFFFPNREEIKIRNRPVRKVSAPTSTWPVAMSADLSLQIVAAPREICEKINKTHAEEILVSGFSHAQARCVVKTQSRMATNTRAPNWRVTSGPTTE